MTNIQKEPKTWTTEEVRDALLALEDPGYRKFHSGLLPGVDNILGVRIPELRKLARQIARGNWEDFLKTNVREWYENDMLQGLVIGCARMDFHRKLALIREFLPRINNWAVCDVFCGSLKDTQKHKEEMWEFLQPCLASEQEYELRFGVVMLLSYFAQKEYAQKAFAAFDAIQSEAYYVRMAVAWAVSVYYVKLPQETDAYLKDNQLDDWTYNKALQKITESYRVDGETKKQIRAMKRKVS